ncbi:hypothetical protein OIDMADRAFT_46481 [Oidiodendron maius Zn]|uniref:Carboxypeptidase n=1 Tax=Oidiodendron maius (strain Zn) TaxID=913774 RepID=A0A0C3C272_OIDMZ|nr:hypothetical protein OIDMADRAFT_46481 [Oidiodendron maius Zn]
MRYLLLLFTFVSLWLLVAGDGRSRTEQQTPAPELERHASAPFLNSNSQKFFVDGNSLPDIPFDVGDSYAGLLPISKNANETRELFFWFFPSRNDAVKDEVTIWLQGGPGSSSLFGLLFENGPFIWQPRTGDQPVKNTYAWNNLTNMVWVDQPVGTGFSQGKPNISNDFELAEEFMGFWMNFIDTFNMKGYKVYITGESYSGYYIPYIGNGFIEANNTDYYNLKGVAINDPIIGDDIIQFEGVAMQYLEHWSNVFGLNASTMAAIEATNKQCGYEAYLEKYFRFPPPGGPFPGMFGDKDQNFTAACDVQSQIIEAATDLNPCFNEDHIFDTCPVLYSPLGPYNVNFNPPGQPVYFDRLDVQKAIHAPLIGANWSLSAPFNVYVGPDEPFESASGDDSQPPAKVDIMSRLIEKTNNVIVGVGGLDFQLPANGTLFVFQNMTWNGVQGFNTYPDKTLFVPQHDDNPASMSGFGDMGVWVAERGLTFYISSLAGHEDPWFTPGVAFRVLATMLGRIPNLSATQAL